MHQVLFQMADRWFTLAAAITFMLSRETEQKISGDIVYPVPVPARETPGMQQVLLLHPHI
jgi:hypothetical protein